MMRVAVATQAGDPKTPNEDWAFASERLVVVLDGATPRTDTGCVCTRDALVDMRMSGKELSAAEYKKMFTDLTERLTTAASAGVTQGDRRAEAVQAEAAKVAAAADPESALTTRPSRRPVLSSPSRARAAG
jgi:hypothetical protein